MREKTGSPAMPTATALELYSANYFMLPETSEAEEEQVWLLSYSKPHFNSS